jgi:ATP-binding cassette, subfamily B, bacterial PglK
MVETEGVPVFTSLRPTFKFLTRRERITWSLFTGLRAALSLLDLLGVMAIGVVAASIALFLTEGSDPNRLLSFAGIQIPAANINNLPIYAGVVLLLFLSKSALAVILTKKSAVFLADVDARAAKAIAQKLYGGDLSNAQSRSADESVFAVQYGSTAAFSGMLNSLATLFSETVLFVLISAAFFLVNPLAAFGMLAYFGLVALVINRFLGKRVTRLGGKSVKATVRTSTHLTDLIATFRETTTLDTKAEYLDRIKNAKLQASRSMAIQYYLGGLPRYIIEAALLIGFSLLILSQARSNDLLATATTLSVFLAGGFRLTGALLPLQNAILSIKGNSPRAHTAFEILGSSGSEVNTAAPARTKAVEPIAITLDSVSFTHSENHQPAVRAISISIAAGTKVAIIGASGSGKSTTVDLICGVLNPSSGRITLTSGKLSGGPTQFFGSIGYVPQRPNLVSGTIADNVALGVPKDKQDKSKILTVLEKANFLEVLGQLPEGVETDIGNLKDSLSGGELQRLGLARALYSEPKLLVLDEATSSLDAKSENAVSKSVDSLRGSATVVVVAHRLYTVQNADRVFLMREGNIADSGTFQELRVRNPDLEKLIELSEFN